METHTDWRFINDLLYVFLNVNTVCYLDGFVSLSATAVMHHVCAHRRVCRATCGSQSLLSFCNGSSYLWTFYNFLQSGGFPYSNFFL